MNCENCDWKRYNWCLSLPCGCKDYCPKERVDDKHIEKYHSLYFLGLGYGLETYCYDIYIKDGIRYIQTNNGTHRKESDILLNSKDLFTTKEAINKKLACSYMAKLL